MAVFNLNDDITLAYLLKKTEEKAKRMVNAAVETFNTFINGCHIYSLPSQLGLTGTPTMKAVAEAMPNYSIGIFNASHIDQSALTALPYEEINNIYIVRHNSYRMFALGVRAYNGVSFDGLRLAFAGYSGSNWVGWKEAVVLNSNGSLHVRGNYVSNQTYNEHQYSTQFALDDSAGTNIGMVRTVHYSGGNEITEIFERRKINGSDIYNTLQLVIKEDGTRVISVSDPAIWRSALGAVNKGGDTMTGYLTQQGTSPGIYLKNTARTDGTAPSSSMNSVGFRLVDKNDKVYGLFTDRWIDDGRQGVWISAIRGSVYHGIRLLINTSGAPSVVVDYPAAFRAGLELGTNGAFPITIAQGGSGQTAVTYVNTVSSIITAGSGITISAAEYCQWGKVAQLAITWKSSSTISVAADGNASNVTVGTIVSGKRPKMLSAGTSHGDDGGPAFYSLATGGTLQLGACGGTGSSRTIAANTTFKCYMTYLLP